MLFQQIVVSAGVVNREVQQLLHSVEGLEMWVFSRRGGFLLV